MHFWLAKTAFRKKRTDTTGRDRVVTDRGLAGFVPWKYLWSPMNAPMFTISDVPLSHWQGHDLEYLSFMAIRASHTGSRWRRRETVVERRKKKSLFPSQLSFQWERKFDMLDLNTFSIIRKQEVSPAAVFWWRVWGVDVGSLPLLLWTNVNHHVRLWFLTWKQKLTLQMSCDVFQIGLIFHSRPRGLLLVLCKWLRPCCFVQRLAIRMYWPFFWECGVFKRQRGRLERERERAKRGPGCVFEYLCSLS